MSGVGLVEGRRRGIEEGDRGENTYTFTDYTSITSLATVARECPYHDLYMRWYLLSKQGVISLRLPAVRNVENGQCDSPSLQGDKVVVEGVCPRWKHPKVMLEERGLEGGRGGGGEEG